MKKIWLWIVLAMLPLQALALEAQHVKEILPGKGTESLPAFLMRLPTSFEAQIFYGLILSGAVGMLASWLNKWRTGDVTGFDHFYNAAAEGMPGLGGFLNRWKYPISQFIWLVGVMAGEITILGFETDSGEFWGWMSVIANGATLGFAGEVKPGDAKTKSG